MAVLEFQELSFEKTKAGIRVFFLKNFYFDLSDDALNKIGNYKIRKDSQNKIEFVDASQSSCQKKFSFLISNGFASLKSVSNGNPAVYIHKNCGIPLIGNSAFGIVDRNTSLIEIKPVTGCNLNCIYCSVNEGLQTNKKLDFVVEKDYLVEELKKLIEFKGIDGIEVHIGTHGEPLLYAPLADLIRSISNIKGVKKISMDTNGTFLTKEKVDELAAAGLTQFNLSLNALDQKIALKMAGCAYDVKKVIDIARYIPKKADLIITPVYLPGVNDSEIPKLIEFAKEIGAGKNCPVIGIQNFLNYRFGRNPVKAIGFEEFYDKVKVWEKKFNVKLILDEKDFNIRKTEKLPLPFKKDEVIDAAVVCEGRMPGEKIAVSKGRNITVMGCHKEGKIRVKIVRSKHNIFVGTLA